MKRLSCGLGVVLAALLLLGLASDSGTLAQDKDKGGLTFEVYKDKADEYRWRLKAANGRIIGTSGQGYEAKADCMHGIDLIQMGAAKAKVIELKAK